MIWDKVMERFLDGRPVPVMLDALLTHALPDSFLDELFEEHAQVQYTRELLFSTVTDVLLRVVMRVRRSVRAAALDHPGLPCSLTALYDKLAGTEPALCERLVGACADRLEGVLDHMPAAAHPEPVAGLRLLTVDGNVLAGTEHRLAETRGCSAAALPGMTVALREHRTGMIRRLLCREDAYTGERALVGEIAAWLSEGDLLMGDRNFCTLGLIEAVKARKACFLFRHHGQLALHPADDGPAGDGPAGDGRVTERMVRLGRPDGPLCRCIAVRLEKPTRDGDTEILLLTNVTAEQASAALLADVYRLRWKIETAFQELTVQLRCEVDGLAYPKAALLGFSLAVTAYNVLAVIKGALAEAHGREKVEAELSSSAVADQVACTAEGMRVALPAEAWAKFAAMTAAEIAAWLVAAAKRLNWKRFKKSKRGPKKPLKKQEKTSGSHRSTARLLLNRKKKSP